MSTTSVLQLLPTTTTQLMVVSTTTRTLASNWTSVGGATVTQDNNSGNDASDSAKAVHNRRGPGCTKQTSNQPTHRHTLPCNRLCKHQCGASITSQSVTHAMAVLQLCTMCRLQYPNNRSRYMLTPRLHATSTLSATASTNPYVYFTQNRLHWPNIPRRYLQYDALYRHHTKRTDRWWY